jgi:hypothetical protein
LYHKLSKERSAKQWQAGNKNLTLAKYLKKNFKIKNYFFRFGIIQDGHEKI